MLLIDGATARGSSRRRELWGLPAAEAEARAAGAARARLARRRDRARRASARCGTRPSPTTAATPAAAASARCSAPSTSRRSRSGRRRRSTSADPAGRAGRGHATCARARSVRRPRSTASSGTLANLLAFNAISTLPTRNFPAATFDGAPALAAEDLPSARRRPRQLRVLHDRLRAHLPRKGGGSAARVEYENVFALGPLCGVSDPDAVLAASARCDELGLDTISAGGTIAWAMECAERGLIDAPWLRFGDGEALLRAIDEIGAREGLGELLAEGSRRAAERRRPGLDRLRAAGQGPGAARLRAAHPAGDGARAWRSTRAAPTTTGRAPTRPTCPASCDRLDGGEPPTSRRRSRPRTAPR